MPDSAIAITRAQAGESLDDVAALQARTFSHAWGVDAIRWELANTDVARLYVARAGGDVIAYCACWMICDELHINSFAVDERWRRHGVGRDLVEHVFREAVAGGVQKATLEVRRSNEAARAFYERLGFVLEGTRREYYRDPREDALVLWHRRLV